ncbi:MAG TPA: hypothetical protein VEU55_07370 [Gemmatimonadales bacterium]|nr:hypothetical protein [Gemmatimonadales bacterium]
MRKRGPRLAGVELYFDDLAEATRFYSALLGQRAAEHDPKHHTKFGLREAFICLERKGGENYPSADKAVVFLEVADLRAAVARVAPAQLLRLELQAARPWAAVRDTEGHTVLLLEAEGRAGAT